MEVITMTLKIITDSACDLPQEIIDQYDIDVLPFLVYIDNQRISDKHPTLH